MEKQGIEKASTDAQAQPAAEPLIYSLMPEASSKEASKPASTQDAKSNSGSGVDDLYKFATTNFQKLDKDGNGYLSPKELTEAAKSGAWQGQDQKYIDALAQNAKEIAALHDDGWFTTSSGISQADLTQLKKQQDKKDESVSNAEKLKDFGLTNFDQLDFDQRGKILGYELVTLNGDGCATNQNAVMASANNLDKTELKQMEQNMSAIGHYAPIPDGVWICKPYQFTTEYGITRDDLKNYPSVVAGSDNFSLVNKLSDELK